MGTMPTYATPTFITEVGYLVTYIHMFKSIVKVKLMNYRMVGKIDAWWFTFIMHITNIDGL